MVKIRKQAKSTAAVIADEVLWSQPSMKQNYRLPAVIRCKPLPICFKAKHWQLPVYREAIRHIWAAYSFNHFHDIGGVGIDPVSV